MLADRVRAAMNSLRYSAAPDESGQSDSSDDVV